MTVHASDIDLNQEDISGLASPDAVAAFFAKLGYETSVRKELAAELLGLTGEKADILWRLTWTAKDALAPVRQAPERWAQRIL